MNESGPDGKRQLPNKEVLTERFLWLHKYGKHVPLALLAEAAKENGYIDAMEYLYQADTQLTSVAALFDIPVDILFAPSYVREEEFAAHIK